MTKQEPGATRHQPPSGRGLATAVLEVRGLQWGSEKVIVEATLGRLEGVRTVEANPVAQTATVSYLSLIHI